MGHWKGEQTHNITIGLITVACTVHITVAYNTSVPWETWTAVVTAAM